MVNELLMIHLWKEFNVTLKSVGRAEAMPELKMKYFSSTESNFFIIGSKR